MSLVVYLAHPVAPTKEQLDAPQVSISLSETRPAREFYPDEVSDAAVRFNLDSARTWLRWLITHTDWAISMPWMPYVETLNDATSSHRHRGLRDDCLMASRCDAIILCGGRVSSGMAMERDAVQKAGKAVVSLVDLGPQPPGDSVLAARRLGDAETLLRRRMREATGG
jgi:hypothetical protein